MEPDIIYCNKNKVPIIYLKLNKNTEKILYLIKNIKAVNLIKQSINYPPFKKQKASLIYYNILYSACKLLKNNVANHLIKNLRCYIYKSEFKKIEFFQKIKIEKNKNGGL